MNSWLILLILLSFNQNGCRDNRDIDCDRDFGNGRGRERDNDCGNGRGRERDNDCGNGRVREPDFERGNDIGRDCDCDTDLDSRGGNNESRFEPRFDGRPFDNSGCGCDNQ